MHINSGRARNCHIDKYIGSDFDKVITVAENIDGIKTDAANITDINTVAANINDIQYIANNLGGYAIQEVHVLKAGQHSIMLTKAVAQLSEVHVRGQAVDSGLLALNIDYTISGTDQIFLKRTYPMGTVVTVRQELSERQEQTIHYTSDQAAMNRKLVDFALSAVIAPYQDNGRTLVPRLFYNGKQYIYQGDLTEAITITNTSVTNHNDGTITIFTDKGNKVFTEIGAEAVSREDLLENLGNLINVSVGSGTTKRTLTDRFKEKGINVKDYGAVGDASLITHKGTDDTAAFKAAILEARKYNTFIYAPPCLAGKGYLINDTLFFGPYDNIVFPQTNVCLGLVGDGDDSTFIVCGDGLENKVVLDYTGLGHKISGGFQLWRTIEDKAPAVGLLTARFKNPNGGVTGNYGGYLEDITMFKYFSIAGRLAITTEESNEIRINVRNDHKDSFGCSVSTADATSAAYTDSSTGTTYSWNDLLGEIADPACKLAREDKAGSNLHQVHIKCDYYYGNNTPDPDKNPCMLRIDGANGMKIVDPFFNNNLTKYDCIQVRKAGSVGVPYGISVINPLYHQQTKAGIRVMTGLNRLDMEQSNSLPGFGFDEAELVIDAYLSGATIEAVDSIIQNDVLENSTVSYVTGTFLQRGRIDNCEIEAINNFSMGSASAPIINTNLSCKTFGWNTDASISNSEVLVRNVLNVLGSRGGTPQFSLKYKGAMFDIDGQIPSSWLGTPSPIDVTNLNYKTSNIRTIEKLYNNSVDKTSLCIEHNNSGFNSSIVEIKAPSGAAHDFNYRSLSRGGTTELTDRKGGFTVYEVSTGGPVLTEPGGKKFRLYVDNQGGLHTAPITL